MGLPIGLYSNVQVCMQLEKRFCTVFLIFLPLFPNRLSQEVFTWTAALLFHSFMISFMFMGLHETVHGTAFRSSYLNGIFKIISGFLTLRPPIHYYYYHWAHHRHTGWLSIHYFHSELVIESISYTDGAAKSSLSCILKKPKTTFHTILWDLKPVPQAILPSTDLNASGETLPITKPYKWYQVLMSLLP